MEEYKIKDKYLLQSVDNALRVIEILVNNNEMGVTEISKNLNLGKTSVFRLLHTLKNRGYINKNKENDKYYLGIKFTHIGTTVLQRQNIVKIVRPYLESLTKKHHETVHLAILDAGDVVFLDKANSIINTIQMHSTIGARMPGYCTGTGKLLLAYKYAQLEDIEILKFDYKKFTQNTIITSKDLIKELKKIREKGYSEDNEEKEIGLTCYAVPIRNNKNDVLAAISISGPSVRIQKKKHDLIYSMQQASNKISKELV